jgi:hypothetical protein
MCLGGVALLGCSAEGGALESVGEADLGKGTQALVPESALQKTVAPIRALSTPGGVYLSAVEQRLDGTGTFTQIFHVYQPDANSEGIRFEIAAKTSTGAIDTAHRFQAVTVTSRPGQADQTQQSQPDASGQRIYSLSTSRQGWYRFQFSYVAPNAARTLTFKAYDASSNSLKIAWSDPPSARVQVKATVVAQQASQVFLKGGAYRNTDRTQFAYADGVTLDGRLLYKRSFDQGNFNFPLGWLSAGQHTLEFSLQASSYNPAKFWFGVNEASFDPLVPQNEWSPVQFLYHGELHTADYDAWNEGVAFAQGSEIVRGVRPAPVRRGTSFAVGLEGAQLNGTGANATLRVYAYGGSTALNWSATLTSGGDYAGGIYTTTGFSTRYREHWRVSVPANAPVGRYVLRVFAPNGTRIGSTVAFYVIHNPYALVAGGTLTKPNLDTYGYDEDEDGVNMGDGAFGSDADAKRDHFTAIYYGDAASGQFTPDTKVTGAFRRTDDPLLFSVLDFAMAAGQGTTSEFETMRRVHRYVSQQRAYGGGDRGVGDISTWIVPTGDPPMEGYRLEDAALYSLPGNEYATPSQAVCYTMSGILAAYARSAGILARSVTSAGMLGGWGEHAFTEVYIPDLPRHGGTTSSSPTSPNSDSDPWYVFDATDPGGNGGFPTWNKYSQAIAPRSQYGRARVVLEGPFPGPVYATTSPLNWDPFTGDATTTNVLAVGSSYASGPEYWLTRSGITGWLGYWEKDVYRINKASVGATRVSVRTLPSGGEYLQPKLCVGSVASTPVMPERCAAPSTNVTLPSGDAYVVVFSDTEPVARLRGDSVQYILELQ